MRNMKALPLMVFKLWPMFKFFKRRSKFKVKGTRSKIMVPCERSCHRNTHVKYESPTSYGIKVMANVKVFQK